MMRPLTKFTHPMPTYMFSQGFLELVVTLHASKPGRQCMLGGEIRYKVVELPRNLCEGFPFGFRVLLCIKILGKNLAGL